MKKVLSIMISAVMLFLAAGINVIAAEDTSAVVYIDYDFEDYTSDITPLKNKITAGKIDSFDSKQTPRLVSHTMEDGNKGLRVGEGSALVNFKYFFPASVTQGKIYLSFDVARLYHTTPEDMFVDFGADSLYALRISGGAIQDTAKNKLIDGNSTRTYHIDQIYEVTTSTENVTSVVIKTYVDGVLKSTSDAVQPGAFTCLRFKLGDVVSYLDNLKISTMTESSFEADIKDLITTDDEYVEIDFTEGVLTSSVSVENVSIKDADENEIAVAKVEKYNGRKLRVYPAKKMKAGSYSIDVSKISGINGNFYTEELSIYANAAPLYYNDMENTTDGKMNGANSPGLITNNYGVDDNTGEVVYEDDGNAGIKPKANGENKVQMLLNNSAATGLLNIRFDVKVNSEGGRSRIQLRQEGTTKFLNLLEIHQGKIKTNGSVLYDTWTFPNAMECTAGKKYSVDLIYNLDTSVFEAYIDGELFHTKAANSYDKQYGAVERILFQLDTSVDFIDNVSISYLTDNSYKAKLENVYDGESVINLNMSETGTLTSDDIVLTDDENNSVEISEASIDGTYVTINTVSPLSKDKKYTISFGDAVNLIGNSPKSVTFSPITELLEVVSSVIKDSEGNVVEDITALEPGSVVSVNINVKNNSQDNEKACLLGGTYVNNGTRLETSAKKDITLASMEETTVTIDITINTPAEAKLICYIWSDIISCEPYVPRIELN